jgi:hypothetical protein
VPGCVRFRCRAAGTEQRRQRQPTPPDERG